jgi:hypothetical protein
MIIGKVPLDFKRLCNEISDLAEQRPGDDIGIPSNESKYIDGCLQLLFPVEPGAVFLSWKIVRTVAARRVAQSSVKGKEHAMLYCTCSIPLFQKELELSVA